MTAVVVVVAAAAAAAVEEEKEVLEEMETGNVQIQVAATRTSRGDNNAIGVEKTNLMDQEVEEMVVAQEEEVEVGFYKLVSCFIFLSFLEYNLLLLYKYLILLTRFWWSAWRG